MANNVCNGVKFKKLDAKHARKLYDKGLSDARIASLLMVSSSTVSYWRKICGLPPNINNGGRGKSSLSIDAANAREHGMTCGQWMASHDR